MWKLKVKDSTYYQSYLQILNGILKLTRTEILVLAQFMDLKNSLDSSILSDSLKKKLLLSSENRKYIQETLDISEQNLNNYIKILKDKKMIIDGELNPKIYINKIDGQEISFKLALQ